MVSAVEFGAMTFAGVYGGSDEAESEATPRRALAARNLALAKWLGGEDSNLVSDPERCGTESGKPSVAFSLIG